MGVKIINARCEERLGRLWVRCPACGKRLAPGFMPDTEAKALPLWCTRCKREFLAEVRPAEVEETPGKRVTLAAQAGEI